MALRPKKMWDMVKVIMLIVVLNLWTNYYLVCGSAHQQVPCYFIFGDSLYDNGNNNLLPTTAKANYSPYGIDFRGGPTGRFSNGRNMADVIAELFGFNDYILPFAATNSKNILDGTNYASGGSGIREETGRNLGGRMSMDHQLRNHEITVSRICNILGDKEMALKYLNKCLYSVGIGNNDYLNNYFMPNLYATSRQYTPLQYATVLVQQYSQQLTTLHSYGARKVALFGIGPIGCTPIVVAVSGTKSPCVDFVNNAVQLFNTKLRSLVDDLNNNLKDAKFIFINIYGISSSLPSFRVTNAACCEVAISSGWAMCSPLGRTCPNRNDYSWWDAVHPSEAVNVMIATSSYNSQSPSHAYPIDIHNLALLQLEHHTKSNNNEAQYDLLTGQSCMSLWAEYYNPLARK